MKHIKHASPGIYTPDQIHTRPLLTVYFEDDEVVTYVAHERFSAEGAQPTIDYWDAQAEGLRAAYEAGGEAMNTAALELINGLEMTVWDLSADQPAAASE